MKIKRTVVTVILALFLSSCAKNNTATVVTGTTTSAAEEPVTSVHETVFSDTTTAVSSELITERSYESSAEQSRNISETKTESTTEAASEENEKQSIPDGLPLHSAAAVYCVEDDAMLYEDNINTRISLASLTKLLTASTALYYLDPETVCTVGSEQTLVEPGSSICYVFPGNKLTLTDLITGMLMASGNDAAYAVAVNTSRFVSSDTGMSDKEATEYFCELMNVFALDIGMTDSHFVNPDGWDDDEQYTTASDLVTLAKYTLSVPEIKSITSTHQKRVVYYSGEVAVWTNSNKLLDPESPHYRENAVGLKTGTTDSAGNCLIAAFEENGKTYISVVAGCESSNDRYELTLKLIDNFI